MEKFKCVNPDRKHLNVLAVVNTDGRAGVDNLEELLRGHFRSESGGRHVTTQRFLRDRVAQIRSEIDLYWWIDAFTKVPVHKYRSPHATDGMTSSRLKKMFHIDENSESTQA